MEVNVKSREQALNDMAGAYLKVRDGKAKCLMAVVENGYLSIYAGDMVGTECLRIAAKVAEVLASEMADQMEDFLDEVKKQS